MSRSTSRTIMYGALIVILSMGIRQSFGLYLQPITQALAVGRETFGLAIALQNLCFGLVQPLVGLLADRIGPQRVLAAGGLLYALGLVLTAHSGSALALNLSLGATIGLALSASTYVVVLGVVARLVAAGQRGMAFGIITAAGSFGMFALVPIAQALTEAFGWQHSLELLALLVVGISLLAFGFSAETGDHPSHAQGLDLSVAFRCARSHRGYWLLNCGFFVCGFHVAFIATHYQAYLVDRGLSPELGANALALIGLANIFGCLVFGKLGDLTRRKFLLSGLYISRTFLMLALILLPMTSVTALGFSLLIGFLWLATVPLTSGIVAQIFGVRSLSTLYGIVFLSHQLGAFLGAWLGGRVFDLTGSYTGVWVIAMGLGLLATLLHLPINDKPLVLDPAGKIG
ncbi:MFS transporter [Geopsychrobacter electrodiphilus]|uniref:MFS transporter n=1 Tax=Geopsychrobacter electrodiphilus TaxID=225196 RepID=UPI00039B50DC|nr:MFS transporter [Geopsychrobacter electrodiphilus]